MKLMNKLPILFAAAALLVGCQSSEVRIEGRIAGNDARVIYLEQTASLNPQLIDSTELDEAGNYRFVIESATATPSLYNLVCNGERIPLFLAAGDRLTVNAVGDVVNNYTVEGSEESQLLGDFYRPFVAGVQQLDEIALRLADSQLDEAERKALMSTYSDEYFRIRRAQIEFITLNKGSMAAVYALYQRLGGDRYLYNGDSDVIYYRDVANAIAERYPDSPYLKMLRSEVERMEASNRLLAEVTETTFPEIEMADMYGKKIKLSSLKGKVILLDFWSAELGNSNVLNAELKELYAKYKSATTPLEIYQVAIDTSKPLWINTVQEQGLPWISVSDLRGRASTALGLYNVLKLPTNFLFDKEGSIVARDIRGEELEQKLRQLTR